MSFGKAFFSSCLGALTALIVFCFLIFIFFSITISSLTSEKEVKISDNSVLHLKLDARIAELQPENPFAGLPILGSEVPVIGLLQLKQSIEQAKKDTKIKGIY